MTINSPCVLPRLENKSWQDEVPFSTTYALFADSAMKYADMPAITFLSSPQGNAETRQLTYSQLFCRITQFANHLHSINVGQTDVVSLLLPNLLETHEIIWGAETAGIANPINPYLEPDTIIKLLKTAKTKVLMTCLPMEGLNGIADVISRAEEITSLETIILVTPPEPCQSFTQMTAQNTTGVSIQAYETALNAVKSEKLQFSLPKTSSTLASLFHTGGTTGVPKLAPHTHENELFSAWVLRHLLDIRPGDVSLVGLPLFHCNAVIGSGLACLYSGANVVIATPLGYRGKGVVDNIWQLIESFNVTMMSGVPTVYVAAMPKSKAGADISSLRVPMVGAAPLSVDVFERFTTFTGVEMLEGYGLTESTLAACFNPIDGLRKIGSIGMRLPFTDVKIGLVKNNRVERFCASGEIGSVLIKGPHVFPGYYQHDNSGLTEDGWLDTGDLGRMDQDGYFWLTGRSKDIIIRGGHNIDPAMIEDALISHEAIALVAAVGQPDAYAGEVPIAYVQLKDGAITDVESIKAWAKKYVPERAAVPVRIEILEQLPVTPVGKIFKPTLRYKACKHVIEKQLKEKDLAATVTVYEQKNRGQVVEITCKNKEAVQAALSDFALDFELISPV